MSDIAQGASPRPAPAAARYQTLAALREAHQRLRQRSADAPQAADGKSADAIRTFLAEARRTGAYLADPRERRAAQGILDYWNAELLTLPDAGSMDFAPSLLEPCNPSLSADPASAPAPADQSGLIRFTAFARQWQAAGRPAGYLLNGGAVEQAKQFWGVDSDLDAFIRASAVQERQARTRKKIIWTGLFAVVATTACLGIGGYYWYESLQRKMNFYVNALKTSSKDQAEALEFLNDRQRFLPPYDLSGIGDGSPLRGPLRIRLVDPLDLKAPNFSGDHFEDSSLRDAKLVGASFVGSNFSFKHGAAGNDLKNALLQQAQFRDAKIASTSFEGAGLYRAVFDRAALCATNFAGADLRRASFWGTSIDSGTKETLRRTAWYLAEGWSWDLIEDFARWNGEDAAWKRSLKASKGFGEDIGRGVASFAKAGAGSIAQALALADIAWTRATWGIDVASADGAVDESAKDAAKAPLTALGAANLALAIVDKLDSLPGDAKLSVSGNILDTKAYILLEAGRAADAVTVFEQMKASGSLGSSESLFRYAIAQYAAGVDKTVWMANLAAALKQGYQPTHELHSLKAMIFRQPEIETAIGEATMRRWPKPEISGRDCPAP